MQQSARISAEEVGPTIPMFCPSADTKVAKRIPVGQTLQRKQLVSTVFTSPLAASDSSSSSSIVRTNNSGTATSPSSLFGVKATNDNVLAATKISGNHSNTYNGSPPSSNQSLHLQNGTRPISVFAANAQSSVPSPLLFHSPLKSSLLQQTTTIAVSGHQQQNGMYANGVTAVLPKSNTQRVISGPNDGLKSSIDVPTGVVTNSECIIIDD